MSGRRKHITRQKIRKLEQRLAALEKRPDLANLTNSEARRILDRGRGWAA